jgi:serine protease
MSRDRAWPWFRAAAAALAALMWSQPAQAAAVNGLIVRFKDLATAMPLHGAAAGEGDAQAQSRAAAREQRVLRAAGVQAAQTRVLGRSMRHLDFGRGLGDDEATQLAAALRLQPEVAWVARNEREHRLQLATPDDPYFAAGVDASGQWWLHSATDASAAWGHRRGVPGLQTAWTEAGVAGMARSVVAVLDSGITRHPDLDAHVLPGVDFCCSTTGYDNDGWPGRDFDPRDPGDWVSATDQAADHALFGGCMVEASSWHGSLIAGMLAAVSNNAEGVAGIHWNGRIVPVRVAGKCGAELVDIIDAMRWAAGLAVARRSGGMLPLNPNPARIINLSFGGSGDCNVYQDTIDELRALPAGVVVVAAAGNEHASAPSRPAKCPGVVGVVALNRDGFKATYSNFGAPLAASGIATVGGDTANQGRWSPLADDGLLTLSNGGLQGPGAPGYSRVFGTSFAAPVVAGVMGLMLSVNPALSGDELVEGLRRSARRHVVSANPGFGHCSDQTPGRCLCDAATCGVGILDAPEALRYARDPLAYQPPDSPAMSIDSSQVDASVALGPDLPPNGAALATPADESGGGGGAVSAAWLLALAAAVLALAAAGRGRHVNCDWRRP